MTISKMLKSTLRNSTIIVSTMDNVPFQTRHTDNVTGQITYTGLCLEMLNILSEDLGFSYQIVEPLDGQWGMEKPDGTFTGIIGQVAREEADMGVGGFAITAERSRVVDFSQPWWEESTSYVMRTNPTSTIDQCLKAVSREVWLFCLTTVIILSVVHWILSLPWSARPTLQSFVLDYSLAFFEITLSALKQAMPRFPNIGSKRTLHVIWWLSTSIISVAYAANLVALMSVNVKSVPVKSLEDLATQTHTRVAMKEGIALNDILRQSENPTHRRLQENIDLTIGFYDDTTRRGTENIISIDELTLIKDYRARHDDPCKIAFGSEYLFKLLFGFPMRKTFPFKAEIDKRIKQMLEAGLLEKWKKKYWKAEPYCPKSSTEVHSATLFDTFGAMLVLFVGISISIIALAMELLFF